LRKQLVKLHLSSFDSGVSICSFLDSWFSPCKKQNELIRSLCFIYTYITNYKTP